MCVEVVAYLAVESQDDRLKQGHCGVRRGQGTRHPVERSWVDRSQAARNRAGAGRMEGPMECAGLHSSSVHPSFYIEIGQMCRCCQKMYT